MITISEYSLIFRPRASGSKVLIKLFQEIECENLCQQKYEERLKDEDFGDTKYGRVRKYLWNLTEYPETSRSAQVRTISTMSPVSTIEVHFRLMPSYPSQWSSSPQSPSSSPPPPSSHRTSTSSSSRLRKRTTTPASRPARWWRDGRR